MPEPRKTVTLADLAAECIKLDARLDQVNESLKTEIRELRLQYRHLYDTLMALQSKVYRLENQR